MTGGRVDGGENNPVDVRGRMLSVREVDGREFGITGRAGTRFWSEGNGIDISGGKFSLTPGFGKDVGGFPGLSGQ